MQALFPSPRLPGVTLRGYREKVMALLDIQAIRRTNFLLLLEECEEELFAEKGSKHGAAARLSRLTGVAQPHISMLKRQIAHSGGAVRTIGDDTARALEKAGKPRGWMDHDHSSGVSDQALRLYRVVDGLTPEQRQIILQTAEAFAAGNSTPPPEDGPDIRKPKPRRH